MPHPHPCPLTQIPRGLVDGFHQASLQQGTVVLVPVSKGDTADHILTIGDLRVHHPGLGQGLGQRFRISIFGLPWRDFPGTGCFACRPGLGQGFCLNMIFRSGTI